MDDSRKKPICPKCGSGKSAKILYGMPDFTEELERRIENKKVVLGGCLVSENMPKYKCNECGDEFGLFL